MKACWACKRRLPHAAYQRDRSRHDGLQARCRDCQSEAMKGRGNRNDPTRTALRERARVRAFKRLRQRYPEAWVAIYREEMDAVGLELSGTDVDHLVRDGLAQRLST